MAVYQIAVLPGDGVGPEVMAETMKALRAAEELFSGLQFECREYPVGALCYQKTGTDLPSETLEACRKADAILYGSTGLPDVRLPDGTEIMPQLTLRFGLDLYAGVRPIKRFAPGLGVLAGDPPIDYIILRENTEGLYASRGGGARIGDRIAVDSLVISRPGTERIVRYAFRLAQRHSGAPEDGKRRVTCVDKANVLKSMVFFRQIFDEVAEEFPEIETEHVYADAMTLYMVQRPAHFDVIVAENMFGDIISDLAPATVGGLGLAPSADAGDVYGLFQPSHGTAPDIAGKGIANPVAQILSAAMMLAWLADQKKDTLAERAAQALEKAVKITLSDRRYPTRDLGGRATTEEVGDAIVQTLRSGLLT